MTVPVAKWTHIASIRSNSLRYRCAKIETCGPQKLLLNMWLPHLCDALLYTIYTSYTTVRIFLDRYTSFARTLPISKQSEGHAIHLLHTRASGSTKQ